MDDIYVFNMPLSLVLLFGAVILISVVYCILVSINSKKNKKNRTSSTDEGTPEENPQELIEKRGVVTEKKHDVHTDSYYNPHPDFTCAIKVSAADGTTDSFFVSTDIYNSLRIGDVIDYLRQGDTIYYSGIPLENVHEMTLDPEPFEKVRDGEKTIELRLNDGKRQKIKAGDRIIFNLKDGTENDCLFTKVIEIHKYPSFRELYKDLPLEKCGYSHSQARHANPEDMRAYYSPEDEARYGVVGIVFEMDMS